MEFEKLVQNNKFRKLAKADKEQILSAARSEILQGIGAVREGNWTRVIEQALYAMRKSAAALTADQGLAPKNSYATKVVLQEFGMQDFVKDFLDAESEHTAKSPLPDEANRLLQRSIDLWNASCSRLNVKLGELTMDSEPPERRESRFEVRERRAPRRVAEPQPDHRRTATLMWTNTMPRKDDWGRKPRRA